MIHFINTVTYPAYLLSVNTAAPQGKSVLAAVIFFFAVCPACRGNARKTADPVESRPALVEEVSGIAPEEETVLPEAPPSGGKPLYIIAGGDVMLQMEIIEVAGLQAQGGDDASGWKWFFHALDPIFKKYEGEGESVIVVNLESPVAEQRVEPKSYPPTFNGPPEALEGMRRAGVDCVTVANNHALDQGRAGLEETIDAVRNAGLKVIGAGRVNEEKNPAIVGGGESGLKAALFSYLVPPGKRKEPDDKTAIALYGEEALAEVFEAAGRDDVDAVVVFLHWIGEFVEQPFPAWKKAVENLVEAGADAVICHGPHVVGSALWVESGGRKAFVAYSLGNLVANFGWEIYPTNYKKLEIGKTSAQRIESRYEALCVLELSRSGNAAASLSRVDIYPLWLEDNRYASFRKGGAKRAIYPMPLPACEPDDSVGCPKGAKAKECSLRWDMIFEGGEYMLENLWGRDWPEPAPCGGGKDPSQFPLIVVKYKR